MKTKKNRKPSSRKRGFFTDPRLHKASSDEPSPLVNYAKAWIERLKLEGHETSPTDDVVFVMYRAGEEIEIALYAREKFRTDVWNEIASEHALPRWDIATDQLFFIITAKGDQVENLHVSIVPRATTSGIDPRDLTEIPGSDNVVQTADVTRG